MSKETKKAAKFGIAEFAKHIGVAPASARDKLRRAGIGGDGSKYEWASKTAMETDAAKLKAPAKKASKPAAKKAVGKASSNKAAAAPEKKAAKAA